MGTMELSYYNKLLLRSKKKSPKFRELSDFNAIFIVHLLMIEFYNASEIWQIFSVNQLLPSPCVWRYLIGRDTWYGIHFLYMIKWQKSDGVNEIKK